MMMARQYLNGINKMQNFFQKLQKYVVLTNILISCIFMTVIANKESTLTLNVEFYGLNRKEGFHWTKILAENKSELTKLSLVQWVLASFSQKGNQK